MTMSAEVRITPGENECEDRVFEFLRGSFFLDEPMNSALNRIPNKEDFRPLTYLKSGYSLAAYVKNGENEERLAGVVLNRVKVRDEKCPPPKTRNEELLFNILGQLEEKTDIWNRVPASEIFYTVILSVGRDFRGLRVGQKLIEESLKKAKSAGFAHAIVECSSLFSSKIVEKFDYEKIGEIIYDEYRDEKGEVLIKVKNPHKAVIKYLKKL